MRPASTKEAELDTLTPTLGSLLAAYLTVKLLAETSQQRYELAARNLAGYMGGKTAHPCDIALDRISVDVLVGYRAHCLQRIKPTTFNTERRHLVALFNAAVRLGQMPTNPFRELPGAPVPRLLPKSIPKPDFMAAVKLLETGKRLNSARRSVELINPQWFWLAVLKTFYFTGMRKRQLVGLRWEDVDFRALTIKLRAQTSKTRREWLVPLPVQLLDDLQLLRLRTAEVRRDIPGETQVFCLPLFSTRKRSFASREMNADNVDGFFQRLRKHLPREHPRISSHRIRHTTATILANKIPNLKVVQEQLGHTSILTTYGYVHPDIEAMREALRVL
jgi:integrase